MYGNQFGHQAYPFQQQHQQQHQHQHQHQAPPSWGTPYESFDGGYGTPAPAAPQQPPLPPERTAGPPSTELALPRDSPRAAVPTATYPGSFSHHQAVAASSHGIVAHAGGGLGFSHLRAAPSHDDLPPAALAPPSTYPPSSESEDSSESEPEESDQDVAVTRYAPPAAPVRAPRLRVLRRAPKKSPYPTETRYVPPTPERLVGGYYPKETRGLGQQDLERPGVSRGGSGLVLKLHLRSRAPDRAAPAPPTSMGPSVSRSRGGSQGSMGGIIQQMDRVFSDVMSGGMLDAGLSFGAAGDEGSGRGVSRSFSAGGSGSSRSGGFGRSASMMSSRTVIDAGSRTLFSRTERTVINEDGTRETNVSSASQSARSGGVASRFRFVCGVRFLRSRAWREVRSPASLAPGDPANDMWRRTRV